MGRKKAQIDDGKGEIIRSKDSEESGKVAGRPSEKDLAAEDSDSWTDIVDVDQSDGGAFIRPVRRGGRRTVGDNRERLAKIKRAAVDRVLEELSTDPEKAGLVMTRDELLDRMSESYAQGLQHAKALDPNKTRYVRESIVECAKARLEKDG